MNILNPATIDEYIVKSLQNKSLSGSELLSLVRKERPRTTKQALYAALRKLRGEEVVIMHHKNIALSSVWVLKMTGFFQLSKHFYIKDAQADEGFLSLGEGDKVSYSFKNPNLTDIFWGHAFDILSEVMPAEESIYIYNPHEWFMAARPESEKTLFNKVTASGKKILITVGNTTPIDRRTKREFIGTLMQYHATDDKLFEKRNYYVNVFGDFLIEAWLDEKVTDRLDEIYNSSNMLDENTVNKIKEITNQGGSNKLTISRNSRKAAKIKKMLGRYFI